MDHHFTLYNRNDLKHLQVSRSVSFQTNPVDFWMSKGFLENFPTVSVWNFVARLRWYDYCCLPQAGLCGCCSVLPRSQVACFGLHREVEFAVKLSVDCETGWKHIQLQHLSNLRSFKMDGRISHCSNSSGIAMKVADGEYCKFEGKFIQSLPSTKTIWMQFSFKESF